MSRTVRHIVRGMRSRDARSRAEGGAARGADLRLMRELNRLLVLNCVREHGPISRVAVARRSGLSRTTVSTIMDVLLNEGFVREGDTQNATSSGGRRAILVHFNASAGYILGVDLGRSHLTILMTDLAATIVARRSGPFDVAQGPGACLARVAAEARALLEEQRVAWNQVVGVGVGIPGPIDASQHTLVSPPRMPGWHGVDVRRVLERDLGVPIYLDNDANLGALGECRFGAGRGVTHLAYIKIATGIGGALVVNNEVYRGSRGTAGEIGHVTVDEHGPLCDCGNRGCLETLAGAQAIVDDALRGGSLCHAGQVQPAPPQEPLAARPVADVADVVQAALAGDPSSRAAIERAGERIGVVLAGLVNLINPSVILVDGGVARAGDLLLAAVGRAVAARSLAAASSMIHIRAGALGDNAIALGGVATVVDAAFGAGSPADAIGRLRVADATGHSARDRAPVERASPGRAERVAARDPPLAVGHE
jgi:predicted NBD/HSP70 family sugar kinase